MSASGRPGDRSGSLRPYASGLAFGFFNATNWMICLGTPMVLLMGQVGATPFQVGLAYSAVFLLLPLQVLSTVALPHFGYKRQMMFAWRARSFTLLIPLAVALWAPESPPPWLPGVLVASVFLFCLLRSLGSCCYFPWLHTLLPPEVRGRYYATDQFAGGIAGVLTLLFCGLLFSILPPYPAYAWQYGLAIVGAVLSNYFLSRLPDVEKPGPTSLRRIANLAPKLCLAAGDFRSYLVMTGWAAIAGSSFVPFAVYYLNIEAGLPTNRIVVFTVLQYSGGILGAWWLRARIDRVSMAPLFRLSLLLSALNGSFWMLLLGSPEALQPFIPLSFLVVGATGSLWNAAHLKYLPGICPDRDRALAISVQSAVVGLISGLTPMALGWWLKTGSAPGMHLDRFLIFFGVAIGIQVALVLAFRTLREGEPSALPAPAPGGLLLRPVRYITQLVNPIEPVSPLPSAALPAEVPPPPADDLPPPPGRHRRGLVSRGMEAVLLTLIRLYQWVLSPVLHALGHLVSGGSSGCRFHPTCSAYAMEAVRLHGPWRGSVLALRRVCRCHPWNPGGADPVPPPDSGP